VNLPEDMQTFCDKNFNTDIINEKINSKYIIDNFNNIN